MPITSATSSGYDVRTSAGLAAVLDDCESVVGPGRVGSLHLNDSQHPLGANRDRHANIGAGELGLGGARAFVNEPRFAALPCVLETPGPDRSGPTAEEVALVMGMLGAG